MSQALFTEVNKLGYKETDSPIVPSIIDLGAVDAQAMERSIYGLSFGLVLAKKKMAKHLGIVCKCSQVVGLEESPEE